MLRTVLVIIFSLQVHENNSLHVDVYSVHITCVLLLLQGTVCDKCGYLLKLGSKRKLWRRWWFVLSNGELAYYKSQVGFYLTAFNLQKNEGIIANVILLHNDFNGHFLGLSSLLASLPLDSLNVLAPETQ